MSVKQCDFSFVSDSPKRWFLLHWLSFITTVTGVLTLLFARGHYSIDVLIAYWITTRLWWIYHTIANNPSLIVKENKYNYLSQFWWFCIFKYFEGKVGRPIPKGFNWPLPKRLRWRPSWPPSSSTPSAAGATAEQHGGRRLAATAAAEPQQRRQRRQQHSAAPQASVEDLE